MVFADGWRRAGPGPGRWSACRRRAISSSCPTAGARPARTSGGPALGFGRFRNRYTEYVSGSGVKRMRSSPKRQCDRTLVGAHARRLNGARRGGRPQATPRSTNSAQLTDRPRHAQPDREHRLRGRVGRHGVAAIVWSGGKDGFER